MRANRSAGAVSVSAAYDGLTQMAFHARDKNSIIVAGEKMDHATALAKMIDTMDQTFKGETWSDGVNDEPNAVLHETKTFRASDTLRIGMSPAGGNVIHLTPR